MNNNESGQNDITKETEKPSVKSVCCGIYGLRNKTNGKWYVGLSRNIYHRWEKYYKKIKCKDQKKIYNALKKYGYDGFDKVILEECSPKELGAREIYWIKFYDSVEAGYNLTRGGQVCSELQLKRLSHYNSFPEEMKKYNIDWKDGRRFFTKEWRENISKAKAGKPTKKHTEETKQNMRLIAIDRERKKRELSLSPVE